MLSDPVMQYRLIKAAQRERWRMAERPWQASVATQKQAEQVEQDEVAPDLTGLVERILQNVWKRLGLPARWDTRNNLLLLLLSHPAWRDLACLPKCRIASAIPGML